MEVQADLNRLDDIIRQAITAIEDSQQQISSIADDARCEVSRITRDLAKVRAEALAVIEQVDAARQKEQQARMNLMRVSRDFKRYNEEEIQRAYESARDIQVRLIILTEREKDLRSKRDELERGLRNASRLLSRAETLSTQVSVALDYLSGNLNQLSLAVGTLKEKREIAIRIIQAQEEERRRVARDLHDGLAQQLAAALLGLEVSQKLLDNDSKRAKQELSNVELIIRDGLKEAREVIFNLRPLSLDNMGLKTVVGGLITQLQERTGIHMSLSVHGHERKINKTTSTCIFRIIQEALNNIIKHAHATQIKVRIEFAPNLLAVQVIDNGCGFNLSPEGTWGVNGQHLGLIGMRERAELIGANLKIDSKPGSGTRVLLRLVEKREEEVGNTSELELGGT
ncbi:MAG: sensor histidine kinase [bacterium]